MKEKFANNGEVQIQYLIVNYLPDKIPLVIIPGAIVGADDFYESIKAHINFYCIIIGIRGRGKSGCPAEGYTKEDQISDIEAVVREENINKFYIMGHSVGGGLASYYSVKYPEKIKGLIIADYAPVYPLFSAKWAEGIRSHYNEDEISSNFINGIVRDAEKGNFTDALANHAFKKLFLKAGKEDSLLPLNKANEILKSLTNTSLKVIDDSGHEMFSEKPEEVLKIIEEFISQP
jgi:pimeloyl-ACP methyl ester carboxylesterase